MARIAWPIGEALLFPVPTEGRAVLRTDSLREIREIRGSSLSAFLTTKSTKSTNGQVVVKVGRGTAHPSLSDVLVRILCPVLRFPLFCYVGRGSVLSVAGRSHPHSIQALLWLVAVWLLLLGLPASAVVPPSLEPGALRGPYAEAACPEPEVVHVAAIARLRIAVLLDGGIWLGGTDAVAIARYALVVPPQTTNFTHDGTGNRTGDAKHAYTWGSYGDRPPYRIQGSVVSFAGGTSVQEFLLGGAQLSGSSLFNGPVTSPTVMYARGSDRGGGVGGLLYSLRKNGAGVWKPKIYAYNARGDVIGQTDDSQTIPSGAPAETWASVYQADGRIASTTSGSSPDRQRANTKEEDPTGLLNEGFRYRDLETGVFLTRDPAGFIDGPNLYTYAAQNPWSRFDPDGLNDAAFFQDEAGMQTPEVRAAMKEYDRKVLKGLANTPRALKDGIENLPKLPGQLIDAAKNPAQTLENIKQAANETLRDPEKLGEFAGTLYTGGALSKLFRARAGAGADVAAPLAVPATASARTVSVVAQAETATVIRHGNSSAFVVIENGVARVNVDYVDKLSLLGFVKKVKSHVEDAGAKSAKVDTGYIIDEDLAIDIGRKSQSGGKIFGGTVKQTDGGVAPRFEIDVPVEKTQ